jgi:hypothetical protein
MAVYVGKTVYVDKATLGLLKTIFGCVAARVVPLFEIG